MKKPLTVLLLSSSVFATQLGYAQSLYAGGSHYISEFSEETGAEGNRIPKKVVIWIYNGFRYISFALALQAAWKDLKSWLDDLEKDSDPELGPRKEPDLTDKRIMSVCTFYYKYKNEYDLSGMGKILEEDNDYCI